METTTSDTPSRHPVLACVAEITAALESVAEVDPIYMTTPDKAEALVQVTTLTNQLEALRLRLIAASGDVAEQDGSRNVGAWLGPRTLTDTSANTAAQFLATDLDQHWHQVAAALGDGRVNLAQARVIVTALNRLGEDIAPDLLRRAEAHLVREAGQFGPKTLKRLGDKILEIIAPDDYEDQERKNLEEEQRRANAATRLNFRNRGDGSTDITARVPDSVAARLKAYLEAFTSPRQSNNQKHGHDNTGNDVDQGDGPITDPATGQRIPAERRRGHAFCALLEALDPTALPVHGGKATTLVVTIDWSSLQAGTGGATLPDGSRISVGEARRLACTAGVLPAVLGGQSEVLALGRTRRLFTPAQSARSGSSTPPAAPKAARSRPPGARPTTPPNPGARTAGPISRTASSSATGTTTAPMTTTTTPNTRPTGPSASTSARRPTATPEGSREIHRPLTEKSQRGRSGWAAVAAASVILGGAGGAAIGAATGGDDREQMRPGMINGQFQGGPGGQGGGQFDGRDQPDDRQLMPPGANQLPPTTAPEGQAS